MPRPAKHRWICEMPRENEFGPLHRHRFGQKDDIYLQLDEYETIRLIDQKKLTQEACAKQMNIARTTVQGIYEAAREKIANAIVEGKRLIIQGGSVLICNGKRLECNHTSCNRQQKRFYRNEEKL